MPAFLVPLHEFNTCHNPEGAEGGQFCSKAGSGAAGYAAVKQRILALAGAVTARMAVLPEIAAVQPDATGPNFKVGGRTFDPLALYVDNHNRAYLNATRLADLTDAQIRGVVTHEVTHYLVYKFEDDVRAGLTAEMIAEDGHSAYAKSYWARYEQAKTEAASSCQPGGT
jgi:hypothetical protein